MTASRRSGGWRRSAAVVMLLLLCLGGAVACGKSNSSGGSGSGQSSTGGSGNLQGGVGGPFHVGDAIITVKSLQAAFQPVSPAQKLSDEALVAPASGVTFYQAYVRIENRGQYPLRVDAEDFVCRIGNTIATLELTRSGPAARSLIYGTSLDLVLTFRGPTGAEPTLIYNPPWHNGTISFNAATQNQATVTTGATQLGSTTTTQVTGLGSTTTETAVQ